MCLLFQEDKRRFHKVTRREVMEFDAVPKEIIGCAIEVHRLVTFVNLHQTSVSLRDRN